MELKNYILHSSVDLVDSVIDEVALEGLDGITLEALWQRLAIRFHENLPLADSFMEQVWSICVNVKGFSFFELKKAREKLIIFDRFELLNDDEPKKANVPKDIYPHFPIDDMRNGIRGSSSSYNTRIDITFDARNYSLEDIVQHYYQKFIIVASQSLRERALIGDTACPVMEMNTVQYCFLERVGRARYHGDVSHGKTGLSTLSDDPKSMFYHRKFLLKQKLITKQAYSERVSGNSYSSSLLHLTRFYVERRPKFILMSENIINYLKTRENYIASYDEVKEKLQINIPLRKIFKTPLLKNIIRTDIKVPYENLHPRKASEWQKNGYTLAEKLVRAVQLVDANVDISHFWGKHDGPEEEESYDLDISKQKLNLPFLKQANRFVEESRQGGLSQTELGAKLGMTKLHTRTILRNLAKTKIVATYMNDVGKQRVTKYISKKFEHSSQMSKQLEHEMDKMKEFNRTSQEEQNEILPPNLPIEVPIEVVYPMHEEVMIAEEVQNEEVRKDERLFPSVNRILKKYKALKSRARFKYTALNLSQLHATAFWHPSQNQVANVQNSVDQNIPIEKTAIKDVKVKLVCSKPQNMSKAKTVTGFLENLKNSNKKNVTYRLLKRANLVVEAVKASKVIDDASKLLKLIKAEEDKEGYDVRIDKKSLARLLQRLAKDNLVKYIRLTLSDGERQKIVTYICDPTIEKDHSLIESAVEQAKIKFCLLRAPNLRVSKKGSQHDLRRKRGTCSINPEETSSLNVDVVLDPRIGKKYGYNPKFLRMKNLHILLFYLIYEHPGHLNVSKREQIEKLRSEGASIDDELAAEMSEVYTNEVDWKMFIPPLPKHPGWADGWVLMTDILLRLPLSIFTKIYNIPYVVPEIETYLNHPIKRHFLVKDVSAGIRHMLLKSRKYIFSTHETITRLCYLGLVQFGPQKLKEKDQVFLFLNRRSQLLDTTSSSIGYHKIEKKTYPVMKYEFQNLLDVEKYWYDMWEICIDTCLGGRLAVQGKDILLEDLSRKAAMIQAARPRPPEEVLSMDNGEVPGDRQGAAGIDSAFFAHLKRNWTWGSSNYTYHHYKNASNWRNRNEGFRNATLEEIIEKNAQQQANQKESSKDAKSKKAVKAKLKQKSPVKSKTPLKPAPVKTVPRTQPRKKAYVRRVMPRRQIVRSRVKYDEVDYRALQRMDKLRVDWEPHEDNILLMCKVAMMYLFPNPRKQFVTFIAVRDALRSYSKSSQNKTSRACQRRLLYMLKQPQTISSVMLGIEEIKQNYFVNKRFGGLVHRIKGECHNPIEYEEKVAKIFKELVAYIAKKYYSISNMEPRDPIIMPHTVQEFNLLYELKHPSKTLRHRGFTVDVQHISDIHSAMINSVIHSSMCSGKDRRTWAYQLFKVYQQYSESLLRAAMFKIRADQMVSVRKTSTTTFHKYGNCMPMSNSQYQLSLSYYHKFQTKWPYSVFSESYHLLLRLIQWHSENQTPECNYAVPRGVKGTEVLPITGGIVAGIHDLFAKEQLDFDIEMPDQIIMLDPRLQEKDEQYLKIAKRYQSLLMNYAYANESAGPRGDLNFDVETQRELDLESMNVEEENEVNQEDEEGRDPNQEEEEGRNSNQGRDANQERREEQSKKQDAPANYTMDSVNSVFLEEPQINWNQNEGTRCVEIERVDIRNLKRCFDSEDEDPDLADKRPMLETEDRVSASVSKRTRIETEDETEEVNKTVAEKATGIRTARQYYAYNLKKMQHLLRSIREPSRSLQRALALQQQHYEADFQSNRGNLTESQTQDGSERENEIERRNEIDGGNEFVRESEFERGNESERENETIRATLDEDPLQVDYEADEQNYSSQTRASIDANDPNDPKYTRLGMLRMREEFNDITVADSHHAHDFFVVNSFNIFYSLKLPDIESPRKLALHKKYEVPAEIIPLNINSVNNLISKIKTYAVFPKNHISYEEFQQLVSQNSDIGWKLIDRICRFIKERKELGATLQEIAETFHKLGETLCEILSMLSEFRQIIRSGVTVVRFIHNQYIDPWLIHSYKILRLEQEAQPLVPKGSVYVLEDEPKTSKSKSPRKSNPKSPKPIEILESDPNVATMEVTNSEGLDESSRLNTSEGGDPSEGQPRRSSRKKTTLLKQNDVLRAAQMLDLDSAEEIKVVIKPWIRVDGALNRRVLDRMMGAVLSYCIKHPGATLSKVQNRFVPALHPFHTRELVEMLVELECLNVRVLKAPRISLFTKPVKLQFSGIPGLAQDEELVIESEIGATLLFGTYLSSKTYTSDFLS